MIIIKIIGGLGNQMFQYSYARAMKERGYDVKIDISEFDLYKLHGGYQLDKYNIDLKVSSKEENKKYYTNGIVTKILRKIGIESSKVIKEKSLFFDSSLLELSDNNYIVGYYQCENYFKDIRDILLEQFTIKKCLSNYTIEIEKKINNSLKSCSIHIRRGDYINNKNINIHGVCSIEYYKKAIDLIKSKFEKINFFIFSDDITWVKENLKVENATYIDSEEKRIPHEDIYLMSLCHYNIIANSSFSWWGAWLNKNNEKIVVAPKIWFINDKMQKQATNIIPEKWIKV
jgi:hypothetical protein